MEPIPGCVRIVEGNVVVALAVVDLQMFQEYSRTVVNMQTMRELWIAKNPKPSGLKRPDGKEIL